MGVRAVGSRGALSLPDCAACTLSATLGCWGVHSAEPPRLRSTTLQGPKEGETPWPGTHGDVPHWPLTPRAGQPRILPACAGPGAGSAHPPSPPARGGQPAPRGRPSAGRPACLCAWPGGRGGACEKFWAKNPPFAASRARRQGPLCAARGLRTRPLHKGSSSAALRTAHRTAGEWGPPVLGAGPLPQAPADDRAARPTPRGWAPPARRVATSSSLPWGSTLRASRRKKGLCRGGGHGPGWGGAVGRAIGAGVPAGSPAGNQESSWRAEGAGGGGFGGRQGAGRAGRG